MINRDDNPKNLPKPQKTYRNPKKPTETPKNLPHPVGCVTLKIPKSQNPKIPKTQKPKNPKSHITLKTLKP